MYPDSTFFSIKSTFLFRSSMVFVCDKISRGSLLSQPLPILEKVNLHFLFFVFYWSSALVMADRSLIVSC